MGAYTMSHSESATLQKPEVFIKNITFNDNTQLSLKHDSIIVFTGANNSGKSQVLRDIEQLLMGGDNVNNKVVSSIEPDFVGDIEYFYGTVLKKTPNGNYKHFWNAEREIHPSTFERNWKELHKLHEINNLFIHLLNTEERLKFSNSQQSIDKEQLSQHPIHVLYVNKEKEQIISSYFRQAFGTDLMTSILTGKTIHLYVGNCPNRTNYTIEDLNIFDDLITAMPKLQEQGDGMRSFASILLDTFTSEHTITLIDEPEAFLHPPQARLIGKMLAKNNPCNRQLFISTHSNEFLQGLLDANNKNVNVIHIHRNDNLNHMSVLNNLKIKTLWSNPLLRYSNILSGLFHEKVVVCESDYDCLFYQAIMDAMYEIKAQIAPDILFTHCGGKDRIGTVIAALRALNVTVVAIADFDLLNNKSKFKEIVTAFNISWDNTLEAPMNVIYDSMNSKNDSWKNIKQIGKYGFTGDEPPAYETVENHCLAMGLFIIPFGEIECFDKTVKKSKKEWVYYILENCDLAKEPKLSDARAFVQSVIDFKDAPFVE